MNKSFVLFLNKKIISTDMTNFNNEGWEEVRGLSWLFIDEE